MTTFSPLRAILRLLVMFVTFCAVTLPATASERSEFQSIDGGVLDLDNWKGQPVLVVNTASRCGFTPQYNEVQALYDAYKDRGLVVVAVPSQDFKQELSSDKEVAEFRSDPADDDDHPCQRSGCAPVLQMGRGAGRICAGMEFQQDPDRAGRARGRILGRARDPHVRRNHPIDRGIAAQGVTIVTKRWLQPADLFDQGNHVIHPLPVAKGGEHKRQIAAHAFGIAVHHIQ